MKRLKVAVIGVGLIGKRHVELVSANADCELVALCDANEAAAATAATYHVPFYRDYRDLLAGQTFDGAIIATPTNLHAPVGIACAKHKVHILVEKPIAGTVAEAQHLAAAADRHGVHLLVGHHRRHNPLVQQARQIVQTGQLGELVGVTAAFALLKADDYYQETWRTQAGGGPILTNLIHDLDNLRFICGEIRRVYAVTSSRTRRFAVEDTASLTLEFANGALGSVFVSDATPAPWSYELTSGENPAYPRTDQDCYRFLGSKGALAFPSMTLWHYSNPEKQGWWQPIDRQMMVTQPDDALQRQLAHFCRVMRGEEPALVSGSEGVKTLAVTQAVLESAQRRIAIVPDG